jgi:hypothetical protein
MRAIPDLDLGSAIAISVRDMGIMGAAAHIVIAIITGRVVIAGARIVAFWMLSEIGMVIEQMSGVIDGVTVEAGELRSVRAVRNHAGLIVGD